MKRCIAALLALILLIAGCAALAECEGWAVVKKDTSIRQTPDPKGKGLQKGNFSLQRQGGQGGARGG